MEKAKIKLAARSDSLRQSQGSASEAARKYTDLVALTELQVRKHVEVEAKEFKCASTTATQVLLNQTKTQTEARLRGEWRGKVREVEQSCEGLKREKEELTHELKEAKRAAHDFKTRAAEEAKAEHSKAQEVAQLQRVVTNKHQEEEVRVLKGELARLEQEMAE